MLSRHGIRLQSPCAREKALRAARNATFALKEDWTFSHTWLFDDAVFGRYPEDLDAFRRLNDTLTDQDRSVITEPMDFIGLNAYSGTPVDSFGNKVRKAPGFPRTALKWPVTPECLYFGPCFLYERFDVDYETQERMIKDSGHWYRNVIKNNGNEC